MQYAPHQIYFTLITTCALAHCDMNSTQNAKLSYPDSAEVPVVFQGLGGVFKAQSRNMFIAIDNSQDRLAIFKNTPIRCVPILKHITSLVEFNMFFGVHRIDGSNDEFFVSRMKSIGKVAYRREPSLPGNCRNVNIIDSKNKDTGFNIFWTQTEQKLPFFEQKGIAELSRSHRRFIRYTRPFINIEHHGLEPQPADRKPVMHKISPTPVTSNVNRVFILFPTICRYFPIAYRSPHGAIAPMKKNTRDSKGIDKHVDPSTHSMHVYLRQ